MVARISSGKNISKILNYNEDKLKKNCAEILAAHGFLKDADRLSFHDKLNHFKRLISLNDRAHTNALHVSLNFDPSEQIDKEKLVAIADRYMSGIGFGDQPYLIYNHFDAGHPHIHIVSTNITSNGKRISMHNIGRNGSEPTRKQIEKEFNLIKADGRHTSDNAGPASINAQKVIYAKSATKRAIANVLTTIISNYKYTSLHELNAVLKLYNVVAETGQPGTRLEKFKGVIYRVLDSEGNRIGTPIKASAFHMKPTLAFLEKKFTENEKLRAPHKKKIQASVAWILNKNPKDLDWLKKQLEKENISLVIRKGKEGIIYGLTYIDHKSKTVFNGSDLGKSYSAKSVLEKFSSTQKEMTNPPSQIVINPTLVKPHHLENEGDSNKTNKSASSSDVLLLGSSIQGPDYIPYQLKRKNKKRRRKISF